MSEARLSILNPVRSVRILLRSPAYRIAARRRRRRVFAIVFGLLFAGLWVGSAVPAVLLGPEYVDFGGLVQLLILMAGRALGGLILAVAVLARGVNAFAPERRGDSLDQLVMAPLARSEVVLARWLAALAPVLPALLVASSADLFVFPLSAGVFKGTDLWVLFLVGVAFCATALSAAALIFTLGFFASLKRRTTGRALGLSLLLLLAAAAGEVLFYYAFVLVGMACDLGSSAGGILMAGYVFAAALARLTVTVLILWRCVRRFDVYALGEKSGELEPLEFNSPRTP